MGEDKQRDQVVRYWWSKSEESLAAALRELNAGALAFAMNRVYYDAYAAVPLFLIAACPSKNIPASGPPSIANSLKRVFLIRNGESSMTECLKIARKAITFALIEFERDYVENHLGRCREFLANRKPFISTLK